MDENYCALALALTSKIFLLPEEAFQALSDGNVARRNRNWDDVVPEMIRMREQGFGWQEVADTCGYSVNTARSMVTRFKNRRRVVA